MKIKELFLQENPSEKFKNLLGWEHLVLKYYKDSQKVTAVDGEFNLTLLFHNL